MEKDEILHTPHEACRSVGFILAGTLRMSRLFSSGREITFRILKSGEMYGELFAFAGHPYPCWVAASDAAQVFEVDAEHFTDLFRNPLFVTAFMADIAEKSRRLNQSIELLSLPRVAQRLAHYLLFGTARADEAGYTGAATVTALAERLACSREAVSREIGRLTSAGILEGQGAGLKILDRIALEDLLFR